MPKEKSPIYCIYTNKVTDDPTPEHIIPLSLGGCNEFCIPVDNNRNIEFGSKVDGKMGNSALLAEKRRERGYAGHQRISGKPLFFRDTIGSERKAVQLDIRKLFTAQGEVHLNSIKYLREQTFLKDNERRGEQLQITFTIDEGLELAFTAKVLLAAAYFVYGEAFIKHADHTRLRKHIDWYVAGADPTIDPKIGEADDTYIMSSRTRHIIAQAQTEQAGTTMEPNIAWAFASLCQFINESCVIFRPYQNGLCGTVGIGSIYIATIIMKADGVNLAEGINDGWVLYIKNRKLVKERLATIINAHDAVAGIGHLHNDE